MDKEKEDIYFSNKVELEYTIHLTSKEKKYKGLQVMLCLNQTLFAKKWWIENTLYNINALHIY